MRLLAMPRDNRVQGIDLSRIFEPLRLDQFAVAAPWEVSLEIQHIGHASGHTSAKVRPGFAEHNDDTAGHVFAGVRANALNHSQGAAVAHRETLARASSREELPAGRAVEHGIAQDGVLVRGESGLNRWR